MSTPEPEASKSAKEKEDIDVPLHDDDDEDEDETLQLKNEGNEAGPELTTKDEAKIDAVKYEPIETKDEESVVPIERSSHTQDHETPLNSGDVDHFAFVGPEGNTSECFGSSGDPGLHLAKMGDVNSVASLERNDTNVQPDSIMSQSMGSEESASSDERFVKVKICEVEDSSKGSSQSGKENLEFEEQISMLTSECTKLKSNLVESQEHYLKVKLELESHLLESQTQCSAEAKSSQEIQRLKDLVKQRDDELMDLRILVEEALPAHNSGPESEESKSEKKLMDMFSSLISTMKKYHAESRSQELNVNIPSSDEKFDELKKTVQLQLQESEDSLSELSEKVSKQSVEIDKLAKEVLEKEEENVRLSTELKELKENEENVIGGYQAVSSELVALQQSFDAQSAQLQQALEQLSTKPDGKANTDEVAMLKEELLAKDEDMMEIQTSMDELSRNVEEKSLELTALNEKLQTQEKEISALKEKERNAEEAETNLKTQLSEKDIYIARLKAMAQKLNKQLKRQTQETAVKDQEKSSSDDCPPERQSPDLRDIQVLQDDIIARSNELIKSQEEILLQKDEIMKLNEEILSLRTELGEVRATLSDRELSLTRNAQEIGELEAALNEKNSEIEQLVGSIDAKTEELTSCANLKGEEMQSTIEQYQLWLEEAVVHSRGLQELLNEKLLVIDQLEAEKANVSSLVTEMNANSAEKDEYISILKADLEKNIALNKELQNSMSHTEYAKEVEINQLKEINAHAETEILSLKTKLEQVSSDHNSLRAEREELAKLKDELTMELATVSDHVKNLKQNLAELGDVRNEYAIIQNHLHQSQTHLEQLKIDYQKKHEEAEELLKLKDQLTFELQTESDRAKKLKQNVDELSNVRNEHAILQNRLLQSESHIDQMKIEYERKCEEVEALREMEVLSVKQEVDRLKRDKEELQSQVVNKHELLLRVESENANLRNEIQSQEVALMETRERAGFFETEIRSVTHSTAHLETDINHLRETVIGLEAQLANANTQIQSFKERIERDSQEDRLLRENIITVTASTSTDVAPLTVQPTPEAQAQTSEFLKTLTEEKEFLEKKIDLLQSKISEIEISEIKSFEECLMLKGWVRQLEFENLKYQDELRDIQSNEGSSTNAKEKTLQNEVLRLVYTLQERDNRCGHLTTEITRLLEERDSLQLKLSNVLKQNVLLHKDNQGQDYASVLHMDSVQSKITELENLNYAINIDLRREKEARRLVQEQLLLSQNSRYYFGRGAVPIASSGSPTYSATPPQRSPTSAGSPAGSSPTSNDGSLASNPDEPSTKPPVVHI